MLSVVHDVPPAMQACLPASVTHLLTVLLELLVLELSLVGSGTTRPLAFGNT